MMPMEFYREFGTRLRDARKRSGLSQDELAIRVGMSRPALANIESGRQRVALHNLPAFATVLGVEPDDLLPEAPPIRTAADIAGTYGARDRDIVERIWQRAVRRRKRERAHAS